MSEVPLGSIDASNAPDPDPPGTTDYVNKDFSGKLGIKTSFENV
jgi:hypothetical protein